MNQKQLAIIIPAYKQTYLRETLESIANQTNKDFKLYIGDDCSPYNLKSIVDDFKDRIDLVYHRFDTNLGGRDLVAQWERCIALSKDEPYIWLFSDDDIMEPECVNTFQNIPTEIKSNSIFHFNIKILDSRQKEKDLFKTFTINQFPAIISAGEFLDYKARGKCISYVVEFIFSRKIYYKIEGFKNFDLAWGSDMMTWLKMASLCKLGIYTETKAVNSCVQWRKSYENISPNSSYPILIRKLKSLILNAEFIKYELNNYADCYKPYTNIFRYVRFPLNQIYINSKNIKKQDINNLCNLYRKKIGYPIITETIRLLSIFRKYI